MSERQLGIPPRAPRVAGANHEAVIMRQPPYRAFATEAKA
jgi:hypothetical protein